MSRRRGVMHTSQRHLLGIGDPKDGQELLQLVVIEKPRMILVDRNNYLSQGLETGLMRTSKSCHHLLYMEGKL